jgi:Rad3-related DNA helicase
MRPDRNGNLRHRIALEAARIIADLGHHDFRRARQKAAERLGCRDRRQLPTNAEIERALQEYQRLFRGESQHAELQRLRQIAIDAMSTLEEFRPRLVGPVLSGSADKNSTIALHLFSDTPEQIAITLMEKKIPWQDGIKKVHYPRGVAKEQPLFRFHAGETEIELIWFAPEEIRHSPLSPVNDRPEKRASLEKVRDLLEPAS